MQKLLFISLVLLSFTSKAINYDTIPANNPLIEYTGRIDFTDSTKPVFAYSGVSIRACFTGTSVGAILSDYQGNNYFNVLIDGKVVDTLNVAKSKQAYILASGLENKLHEIELFKRTELQFGKTTFEGFLVEEGTELQPIENEREHFIEYIGNSITCGYGNEGENGGTFGPTTENHFMTYAAITSRNFNARHMAVSYSGVGVYRNYAGPAEGNSNCMSNNYTRIFFDDEQPIYSFDKSPDIVCINLGTNDFSSGGGDSARYVQSYFRLLDTIQTKYDKPDIICLAGPMMSGSDLNKIKRYLKFIADSASRKQKGNIYFFELSAQTSPYGIDYHPTVKQHIKNSNELTSFIKQLKGWAIKPIASSAVFSSGKVITLQFNTSVKDDENNFSGLEVELDGSPTMVDSIALQPQDSSKVNIYLHNRVLGSQVANINYKPGTISSTDNLKVDAFDQLAVDNQLGLLSAISGRTNETGDEISFVFNVKLGQFSSIDGLTMRNQSQVMEIDSFAVMNNQLITFLHSAVTVTDTITANYQGTSIYGLNDALAATFENMAVKNKVTVDVIQLQAGEVNLYPNPNDGKQLFYSLPENVSFGNGQVVLIESSGRVILRETIKSNEGVLNPNIRLYKGIYLVRFFTGKQVYVKMVVVE